MNYNQKIFTPVPPDKGSFPLDHEGECKTFMLKYMKCLHQGDGVNTECRQAAKDYLECRMDRQLMAREEWSKLGYADMVTEPQQK
jgi:cytochrome c oxidase assembly protein subunit 19